MLEVGNGMTESEDRAHFTMWCMMNSPLMLGMDLRRITKDDEYYKIITNQDLIELNQDKLGIQAKRIWTSITTQNPDKDYITDNNRSDVLAKPLSDGSVAISFINLSDKESTKEFSLEMNFIKEKLGNKIPQAFAEAKKFTVKDLWTKEITQISDSIRIKPILPCENVTVKITPVS